jgi:hypothetical protein
MARKTASTLPEQGTLFEDRFLEDYAGQIMRSARRRLRAAHETHETRPRNDVSDIVEADLRRAARLKIKVQDEIDPQFRFLFPVS